jgi:exosortase A
MHGFLILPLSAYMIWRMRSIWLHLPERPSFLGLFLLALAVLAWSMADAVAVQVVAHFAVVAMLVSVVWTVYGTGIVRVLHFPLIYAFLAVPFGEFLIPPLMDWTASFTVTALQITGIPVLRDGNYFALPSGNFHVIEACSGVRYLVVTVVLGLYFAHEYFAAQWKRLIFILGAALAVIVANGVRAYLIVVIAHYSDMQYGTGQDHIYLGYVIFVITIAALFWIGRRYEDVATRSELGLEASSEVVDPRRREIVPKFAILATISFLVLLSGPQIPLGAEETVAKDHLFVSRLPRAVEGWQGPISPMLPYRPEYSGYTSHLSGGYEKKGQLVEIHVIYYSEQKQGAELIGFQNHVIDPDVWRSALNSESGEKKLVAVDGLSINSATVTDDRNMLHLWYWYDVGGHVVSSPTKVKLFQFWNQLTGNVSSDAVVVLVTRSTEIADSSSVLEAFTRDHQVQLRTCLRLAEEDEHTCASGPN